MQSLVRDSVLRLGPNHYATDQVEAWASVLPTTQEFRRRIAEPNRKVWIAAEKLNVASIVGMIDLEVDGHIDFLYVHPSWVRRGVAAALYEQLEVTAVSCGHKVLFVEASEGAKPFFASRGFRVETKRDMKIGFVDIWNYRMTKQLF